MTEFRKRSDRIIAILHQLTGWFWIQLKSDAAAICDAKAAAIFTPQDPAKRGHLLILCEPNGDSAAGWALAFKPARLTAPAGAPAAGGATAVASAAGGAGTG